jgi:hypothetical protein
MSLDKIPKSDRFQILTAVVFMVVFAALFLIIAVPQSNMTVFVCRYAGNSTIFARMCSDLPSPRSAGSSQIVASRVISACLNREGLAISVAFDEPLTGASDIQVFTTGDDYFPSEQGISDSFKINMTVPDAADHLDFMIPVDAMPVGEQIFGNFFISGGGVSSFVAYSMNVTDCSISSAPTPDSTLTDLPTINSATCLPNMRLMIAFEFKSHVLGQYRASVADIPYQLASVINQPATLFFSGEPPPAGQVVIRLVSANDEEVVFEETYTPPVCGVS